VCEREREGERKRKREREREYVCVYVCSVCVYASVRVWERQAHMNKSCPPYN